MVVFFLVREGLESRFVRLRRDRGCRSFFVARPPFVRLEVWAAVARGRAAGQRDGKRKEMMGLSENHLLR